MNRIANEEGRVRRHDRLVGYGALVGLLLLLFMPIALGAFDGAEQAPSPRPQVAFAVSEPVPLPQINPQALEDLGVDQTPTLWY